jgi:hypothetical protein
VAVRKKSRLSEIPQPLQRSSLASRLQLEYCRVCAVRSWGDAWSGLCKNVLDRGVTVIAPRVERTVKLLGDSERGEVHGLRDFHIAILIPRCTLLRRDAIPPAVRFSVEMLLPPLPVASSKSHRVAACQLAIATTLVARRELRG